MAYASLSEVRALEGMSDTSVFPDATLTEAITWAELLIDRYTGTSWEYKAFGVTMSGTGTASIQLMDDEGRVILYPQTLTSVTIDSTAVDSSTYSTWALYPEGVIIRDSDTFYSSTVGRNVVIAGTAGFSSSAPADIAWCCRTIARDYALKLQSRVDDRALQIQNDYGTVQLAMASTHPARPTALPEVNAILARRRQIAGPYS